MMHISEETMSFLIAVRGIMLQDEVFASPTKKTVQKLIITLEEILINSKIRKSVLRIITGLPIGSQNELTQHTQSTIIHLIGEHRNDLAIREIEHIAERFAQSGALCGEENLFPTGELLDLSNLPTSDQGQPRHARGSDYQRNGIGQ